MWMIVAVTVPVGVGMVMRWPGALTFRLHYVRAAAENLVDSVHRLPTVVCVLSLHTNVSDAGGTDIALVSVKVQN